MICPTKDLYVTTNNTHKRQIPLPPAVLEPAIPASKRPQTQALDSPKSFTRYNIYVNRKKSG
jgi:hypothetical protein